MWKSKILDRPKVAATALALGYATSLASGGVQAQQLTVITHPAIQAAILGTKGEAAGGDVLADWREQNGVTVEWVTANISGLHDRLFRESSLSSTSIDVGFVLDSFATKARLSLFEPLNSCLDGYNIDDIPAAFLDQVTVDGQLMGLPVRHATTALHYNKALLAEIGVDGPPQTLEELFEVAAKLSKTNPDGTRTFGLAIDGSNAGGTYNMLMAYGASLTDSNGVVSNDTESLTNAYQALADLYSDGILPTNFTAMGIDQITQGVWQGRIAMVVQPFNRYFRYNDPESTSYAGEFDVAAFPTAAGQPEPFVARTTVWSMVIPKNSRNKDQACEFIKALAAPESAVRLALNGNGPVRTNTYDDPRVKEQVPYASAEQQAVMSAKFIITPFEGIGRATDLYLENMQAASLGLKSAQDAAIDTLSGIAEIIDK